MTLLHEPMHYPDPIDDAVIRVDDDFITCPGCRVCVTPGRCCSCRMRTMGPGIEPLLPRLVQGGAVD